ncbi:hypothetical protein [Pectobacterium aquaticum]|uniref:Uncharacterized protein n=1 Tax=Pectobacterium aquaticum TaxID=2204145 RepID=A0A426JDF9_9GAMM|nr:hypothetical protein [Pectobacterium aquaticum]RRO11070.1 hypothetical protein DMB85_004895 [Pectobacterium aquaticum]
MPRITDIRYIQPKDRYWVYIDGTYCTSIRARTFKGMTLFVGQEISCDEVKEMESFHFKNQYQDKWEQEKIRIQKVSQLITSINRNVKIEVTGFGANSNEIIKSHPEEQGKPDIEVSVSNSSDVIMLVEVTGTQHMRGNDYWIRPDKLSYCQNHPEHNVWIILHYAEPTEKYVFVKPDAIKKYKYNVISINGTDEYYVQFNDSDEEVHSLQQFIDHLNSLVKQ